MSPTPTAASGQDKLADYEEFTKLAQHFDVIHLLGASVEPQDIPIQFRHLDVTRTQLTLGDKAPYVYARGRGQVRDCFEMIPLGHGARRDHGAAPLLHRDQHNSPRQLDIPMSLGLLDFAAAGQLLVITPFTLAGAGAVDRGRADPAMPRRWPASRSRRSCGRAHRSSTALHL